MFWRPSHACAPTIRSPRRFPASCDGRQRRLPHPPQRGSVGAWGRSRTWPARRETEPFGKRTPEYSWSPGGRRGNACRTMQIRPHDARPDPAPTCLGVDREGAQVTRAAAAEAGDASQPARRRRRRTPPPEQHGHQAADVGQRSRRRRAAQYPPDRHHAKGLGSYGVDVVPPGPAACQPDPVRSRTAGTSPPVKRDHIPISRLLRRPQTAAQRGHRVPVAGRRKGHPGVGWPLSVNGCPAATYSPTQSPVQYHRR